MADYTKLVPFIRKWEGGFSNHPKDKGGATNNGVTLATYRMVYGKNKTVDDLKNMSDKEWEHIFKIYYWDKWKGDCIKNQSIANILVDWYWMSGNIGVKKVQELFGLKVDGIVGSKTLGKINSVDGEWLFKRIWEMRLNHYNKIVKKNPSQKVFLQGWLNRLHSTVYHG